MQHFLIVPIFKWRQVIYQLTLCLSGRLGTGIEMANKYLQTLDAPFVPVLQTLNRRYDKLLGGQGMTSEGVLC